jgi:hypothetical protein
MSDDTDLIGIIRAAYSKAWVNFNMLGDLTNEEKAFGPEQLRYDVEILVRSGERDIKKIAKSALSMIRPQTQVKRPIKGIASVSLLTSHHSV